MGRQGLVALQQKIRQVHNTWARIDRLVNSPRFITFWGDEATDSEKTEILRLLVAKDDHSVREMLKVRSLRELHKDAAFYRVKYYKTLSYSDLVKGIKQKKEEFHGKDCTSSDGSDI